MSRHNAKYAGLSIFLVLAAVSYAQTPSPSELPEGPMQGKAVTACSECHEARIIVQQRLNKAAWTKEVDKMVKWGAGVDPQDRDALIEYLSGNFPVDKPEYLAERSRGSAASFRKK